MNKFEFDFNIHLWYKNTMDLHAEIMKVGIIGRNQFTALNFGKPSFFGRLCMKVFTKRFS